MPASGGKPASAALGRLEEICLPLEESPNLLEGSPTLVEQSPSCEESPGWGCPKVISCIGDIANEFGLDGNEAEPSGDCRCVGMGKEL